MCKETEFFIYLIEQYAEKKGKTADKVLKEWDDIDKLMEEHQNNVRIT